MIAQEDIDAMTPLDMNKEYIKAAKQKVVKLKATDFDDPNVDKDIATTFDSSNILIEEEIKELLTAEDLESFLKEAADLVYVIYGLFAKCSIDFDEAVRRVHKNNMGRMYQADGTIHYREDGKVLKNKDYPKVDLSDLL